MKLTFVHPCIGRRIGQRYIKSWQMEPLSVARLAGLTPPDIETSFFDDRMEKINFDASCDLVAISVETYTACRAYQIASEFRKRSVPVVMGGFHATLCTGEVSRFADHVITGDAEEAWPNFLDDFQAGKAKSLYLGTAATSLTNSTYDRSIFLDKRYLPIGLVETARGCNRKCAFCAIQVFFERSHRRRPFAEVIAEIKEQKKSKKLFFFVDDNFVSDLKVASEFLAELTPLNVRWITQMSIDAAHNPDFLQKLKSSGCEGVLIGFESLDAQTLKEVNKSFATMKGGYEVAMKNLTRAGIRIYGTFIFGNDNDTAQSFADAVEFANRHKFYIAAFNHLTPFPGTPLYERLKTSGRLSMPDWWLNPAYRYNMVPFEPKTLTAEQVRENCVKARKAFYSPTGILRRGFGKANRQSPFMFRHFFPINAMHRMEISIRDGFPLGDEAWRGELLEV
ncbi:MAG: B12-binding domain-containing radical SAM protein [Hyphomicrobiales bacterium]|nr:B12-binding domain-containing radical SAM protein [Hyphomicrobiales bacterium]